MADLRVDRWAGPTRVAGQSSNCKPETATLMGAIGIGLRGRRGQNPSLFEVGTDFALGWADAAAARRTEPIVEKLQRCVVLVLT